MGRLSGSDGAKRPKKGTTGRQPAPAPTHSAGCGLTPAAAAKGALGEEPLAPATTRGEGCVFRRRGENVQRKSDGGGSANLGEAVGTAGVGGIQGVKAQASVFVGLMIVFQDRLFVDDRDDPRDQPQLSNIKQSIPEIGGSERGVGIGSGRATRTKLHSTVHTPPPPRTLRHRRRGQRQRRRARRGGCGVVGVGVQVLVSELEKRLN